VVTQNIDEFHQAAGATDVIELHGSLFKVRCTKCQKVEINRDSPICEALRGRGAPDVSAAAEKIPVNELPRCRECGGLLRPHVVWFGEGLEGEVMRQANEALG
jgi:NAD-dependent SIR2 family protein deacetylase